MKKTNGSISQIALTIIAIAAIGFGAYYFLTRTNVNVGDPNPSTQDVSKNLLTFSDQKNNIQFSYPDNWNTYSAFDRTYLAKVTGVTDGKFYDEVIAQNKTNIEINMSNDSFNENGIRMLFKPTSIGTKKVGDNNVTWFVWKGWAEPGGPANPGMVLSYVISTPYTNKKNITLSLKPYYPENSAQDARDLEAVVGSLKVLDSAGASPVPNLPNAK